MHMRKIYRAVVVAAAAATVAATVTAGVTGASARDTAARHSAHRAAATSAHAGLGPMSLAWIRAAYAEYRSEHGSRAMRPSIKIGNFKDCPKLPAGYQASQFLCLLIHITGGQLEMGNSNQIITRNITVPFAEGTDPSGNTVLVAGLMRAEPMAVLGGIFLTPAVNPLTRSDRNLRLSVKPVGVGIAIDPTGNTAAIISQTVQAINPIFGRNCFVGSDKTPIVIDPTFGTTSPPPPNQPISGHIDSISTIGNELVIIGTAVDNAFAAPRAFHCGPDHALNQVVDEVSALPSPTGHNTAIFQMTVEAESYSTIRSHK